MRPGTSPAPAPGPASEAPVTTPDAGLGTIPDAALCWASAEIRPETLAAVRRYARAVGRVLERDGLSILTWGAACHLELAFGTSDSAAVHEIEARLAAIPPARAADGPGAGGPGPLAIGALAFDPGAFSQLVVPEIAVVDDGTSCRATAVGTRGDVEHALAGFPFVAGAPAPAPDDGAGPPETFELGSARPHAEFRERIARAVAAIRAGELDKVVLVREVSVHADRPFGQHHLLERLRALHPSCLAFAADGFVGASPELLVRRAGQEVVSQPLAGTVARSGDPDEDRRLADSLLASAKERSEHRIVVDAILGALQPVCAQLAAPDLPHLLELRNVAHLATRVSGRLAAPAPGALALAARLHPTPAVGGWPSAAALDYLAKYEELDRDRFAGPVGWVRADGDGEWWIGIRSALVDGPHARLMAGVGIVEGSDPAAELAETQLKLQALLAAAVRP